MMLRRARVTHVEIYTIEPLTFAHSFIADLKYLKSPNLSYIIMTGYWNYLFCCASYFYTNMNGWEPYGERGWM